ncbi:hypothetical protein H1V43_32205 [Streptomyces sp. PSKA54]|uniref:Uncharacterized protein n=1 Tax=Streptomyces himalayensis subsp. aureolus TaxID=2758039 RepID=A0A7W2D769_9ACTN|nr:hypothetical protein [Streptomyces himalayensis]MBA4865928.1 hypothetical protein [Streptomyces himalayensis subsp. aureolus]
MSAGYITTSESERYHTSEECPLFQRGRRGNEAQGIPPRPIVQLTPDEARQARQTRCPECCTSEEPTI